MGGIIIKLIKEKENSINQERTKTMKELKIKIKFNSIGMNKAISGWRQECFEGLNAQEHYQSKGFGYNYQYELAKYACKVMDGLGMNRDHKTSYSYWKDVQPLIKRYRSYTNAWKAWKAITDISRVYANAI